MTSRNVVAWNLWRRDPQAVRGWKFLAACRGSRFASADGVVEWARMRGYDAADLRVVAVRRNPCGSLKRVTTEHPARRLARSAA